MKLLGNYDNNRTLLHRDELIALLQRDIVAGDYGGGKLLDASVGAQLAAQAADFSSLPGIPSGARATAQSVLYPLSLLAARYNTITRERDAFLARMDLYLALLAKDSGLIDQLVAAANLETWVDRRGPLSGAASFYQDFAATHGAVAADLPPTDPETRVLYLRNVEDVSWSLNAVPGYEAEPLRQGIAVPSETASYAPVGLSWSYTAPGLAESLYGPDWAKLSLLAPAPQVRYGDPVVQVLRPSGGSVSAVFEITGRDLAGNVPVFVQTFFEPRRVSRPIVTGASGEAVPFSAYRFLADDFLVLDSARSYDQGIDYTVDSHGRFVPATACANKTLTAHFTELYPAYRSSVNETDWSDTVLFDAASYALADGDRFPLLDEGNLPTGLWIRLLRQPLTDYLFRVDTSAAPDYGVAAQLSIEFDRPAFLDGVHLEPFAAYPAYLTRVSAEGLLAGSGRALYDSAVSGEMVLDRTITLRFPRQLVARLFVTLRQENYELKEHVRDPADQLRRQTLLALEASLPFSSRRRHITPAAVVEGAQYEFGLKALAGEDRRAVMPQDYGVFVAGPFEVPGTPELLRLDAAYNGDVRFYLLDRPFNQLGVQVDSAFHVSNPDGIRVTPGLAFGYTPPGSVPLLAKCQFFVKMVLRDPYAAVERFLLQVTHV